MIEFKIAKGGRPTGKLIAGMLQAKGIELNVRAFGRRNKGMPGGAAVINWGIAGSDGRATLNATANGSKYEQLVKLAQKGIACPTAGELFNGVVFRVPALLRKDRHAGGTDIIVVRNAADWRALPQAKIAKYAYWTKLIESDREFRVWIFRNRHLVTYEKIKKRPADRPGFGRNYAQGYGFDQIPNEQVDPALKQIGRDAIKALNLDFGALDVLHGPDDKYYVLEVNTAPRIESAHRTCGLRLVRAIEKWIQAGFPARA